jgi:hypothetical protein
MFRTIIISVLSLAALSAYVTESSAQHRRIRLSRRQRMHRKWVNGVGTSYLTTNNYNTCWANSQQAVVPSQATVNLKYRSCLSRKRYSAYSRSLRRRRIRRRCRTQANTLVIPTDYQQQTHYVQCLRRTRHTLIRGYLKTVTCGHLFGKRHNRCVRRLNKKIAMYGYQNVTDLTRLDSMYRTRYRGFRTNHPNHKFVKRYHSRHHARKRAIKHKRRAVKRALKHERRIIIKKAIKRERRRERKKVNRRERRRITKKAIKRERRRVRKKAIKRERKRVRKKAIKRERKRVRKKERKRRRRH